MASLEIRLQLSQTKKAGRGRSCRVNTSCTCNNLQHDTCRFSLIATLSVKLAQTPLDTADANSNSTRPGKHAFPKAALQHRGAPKRAACLLHLYGLSTLELSMCKLCFRLWLQLWRIFWLSIPCSPNKEGKPLASGICDTELLCPLQRQGHQTCPDTLAIARALSGNQAVLNLS